MSVAGIIAQESAQQYFQYRNEQNSSALHFSLPENSEIKLLNDAPASKIIFKIHLPGANLTPGSQPGEFFPKNTAIENFKITPMSADNYLFAFELRESLPFSWSAGLNLLEISDAAYVNPRYQKYFKAIALQKKGELGPALAMFRAIIFKDRRNGNAYYKAAQIREAMGQYHLAEINYKHALRLKCDSLSIFKNLAAFYEKRGDTAAAKKYAELYASQAVDPEKEITIPAPETTPEVILAMKPDYAETESVPADSEATEVADISQNARAGLDFFSVISLKSIFYAAGILLLLGGLIIGKHWYSKNSFRVNLQSLAIEEQNNARQQEIQRQKLLEKMQRIAARAEERPAAVSQPEPVGESPETLFEPESLEMLRRKSPFLLNEEYSIPEKKEMARNLNLGIGEVELALNLKAHQRQVNRSISVESEIEKMFDAHMDVSQIARKMQMGQGEVQLLLKMRQGVKQQALEMV